MKDKEYLQHLFWVGLEKFGQSIIQLITTIVLARILTPVDFGIVAQAMIGVSIAKILVDAGLGSALIHKKDASERDYSTIFIYNIAVSTFLFLVLFFIAPTIASYYENNTLIKVIRILSIILVINAVSLTQRTKLQKSLSFKSLSKLSVFSMLISSIFAILYAYYYESFWALVINYLCFALLFNLMLINKVAFVPKIIFDKQSFREMFGYSTKLLLSNLVVTSYNETVTLIIGKAFQSHTLGIFYQGKKLADYQMSIYRALFDGAGFPILSKNRHQNNFVKVIRKLHKQVYFLSFPLILFGLIYAEKIIALLFGEKWIEATVVFQILCFSLFFQVFESGFRNILKATGKTGLLLKIEIAKRISGIFILFLFINGNLKDLVWAVFLVSFIGFIIGLFINKKLNNYSLINQINDLMTPLFILIPSYIGAQIVFYFYGDSMNSLILIFLLLIVFLGLYFLMTLIFGIKLTTNIRA